MKCILLILDKTVRVNLSVAAKTKCEKIRRKIGAQLDQESQDAKAQKQDEKLRQEQKAYLEKLRALPPAEQRKLEEKKRAQDIKKQKSKMSKMVKFWLIQFQTNN